MSRPFHTIFFLFSLLMLACPMWGFSQEPFGNPQEGKVLYEKHCVLCHGKKWGRRRARHPIFIGTTGKFSLVGVPVENRLGFNDDYYVWGRIFSHAWVG